MPRKPSAQEIKKGKKRCARHTQYFPQEPVWRDVGEFWKTKSMKTGLHSNCKRCLNIYRHKRKTSRTKHITDKETRDVHMLVEDDTYRMLTKLADERNTTIAFQANKALRQYTTQELLKNLNAA